MISKAKLKAHLNNIRNGVYNNNRLKVYRAIDNGHCNIDKLSKHLGMGFHKISGRITELLDMGLIRCNKVSGKYSLYTTVTDKEDQIKLRKQRYEAKKQAYLAKGEREGYLTA